MEAAIANVLRSPWPRQGSGITVFNASGSTGINGNAISFTIPGTVRRGDFLCLLTGFPTTNTPPADFLTNAGFKKLLRHSNVCIMEIWWKFADYGDIYSVVRCPGNGQAADGHAVNMQAFRGVDIMNPFDDVTPTTASGTSTNPDAPSITPRTDGSIVIITAASNNNDSSTGVPTNYSNLRDDSGNDTNSLTVAQASRVLATAAPEDPGAWTSWVTGDWITATFCLRPARY